MADKKQITEEEFISLRNEYLKTKDITIRNKIILAYTEVVKAIVGQLRSMANTNVQLEDMVSQGMLVLIECVDKFDETKGMKFTSYIYMRVRGSIIDMMRKQDWIPRRVRKNSNDVLEAFIELSNKLMREPTDREMAVFLDISESEYSKILAEITNAVSLSFEEIMQDTAMNERVMIERQSVSLSPDAILQKTELYKYLGEAIDKLNEQEKKVVSLHYYNGLMQNEIATVVGLTPQRIGQIHARALLKLQRYLKAYQ
ncbi:MAG: FliA/WhiG family RNA polymerase sigma factor [Oscillospiraceae bacterium]|jgi:RNA polymerase sigma factor for flagellar operon FliA|nr:FliA/WhiG family RNA polymerase sigma factor [Oscillospiraceae bacterium]